MAWGLWVDLISGVLLLAAALLVLGTRPRAILNRAFAMFAGTIGVCFVALNGALAIRGDAAAERLLLSTTAVTIVAASGGLAWLATLFPRPLTSAESGRLRGPRIWLLVVGAAYLGTAPFLAARSAPAWVGALGYSSAALAPYYVILAGARLYFGCCWLFAGWMALRFLAFPSAEGRRRQQCVYAVVSILMYPLAFVGVTLLNAPATAAALVDVLAVAVLACLWLVVGERTGHARTGRNIALFLPGVALLFLLASRSDQGFARMAVSGLLGASRTIGLVLLAYGVLRHQMFDIDLKLKVTLRRSTVLAAFGVAFFLGSELLERLVPVQGVWLGLAAAAGTALALRPLQDFARRLADRLMPGVSDSPDYVLDRKLAVYRAAYDNDLADGTLTARERAMLDALGKELGLTAGQIRNVEAVARQPA